MKQSLTQFIRDNRHEIDLACNLEKGFKNDSERRLWVLNDEGLYNWARSKGVRI